MKRASHLATSTMKTDVAPITFATLRFAGDGLDPSEITKILQVPPTRAHRKGERFFAGQRTGYLTGRTGLWYLTTDKLIESTDLADHLAFLERILQPYPDDNLRLMKLRDVLGLAHGDAHISVFWRGPEGMVPPSIPGSFSILAHILSADIEPDFDTEESDI